MKKNFISFSLLLMLALSLIGCHSLSKDYHRYLERSGELPIPASTDLKTGYYITEDTMNHKYSFRAFTSGIANKWIVEFGQMLDVTLQSDSVQRAFGKLAKQGDEKAEGKLLIFDLENYEFSEFTAHIALNVKLMDESDLILDRTYRSRGQPQGGKMFWGGAMATKHAVHQSTQYALNDIMIELIEDINELSSIKNDSSIS